LINYWPDFRNLVGGKQFRTLPVMKMATLICPELPGPRKGLANQSLEGMIGAGAIGVE